MPTNYYKLLQVDPRACDDVIHAAFRALAKTHHDDQKMMRKLDEAKDVLTNDAKRKEHDEDLFPTGKKIVGEYRLLKKLAEGGFGVTYMAEHIRSGKPVCVKHAINVSPEDNEILLEEAAAMWDLRHWGIPAIRNIVDMPDGSLSLVMSYVPGPTLQQVVEKNNGSLDPEHVAWITDRILNILKYLHWHQVIHGDVKPQNVIIQPENHTVVLVDYGLSAVRPHRNTEPKGYTPYFAAPEQEDGLPPLPQTDLFGLGKTMIYALGGDVEYSKVPSTTPKAMCALIKRLVKLDVHARPKVWSDEDLCATIHEAREEDFGRVASGMKPLKI